MIQGDDPVKVIDFRMRPPLPQSYVDSPVLKRYGEISVSYTHLRAHET